MVVLWSENAEALKNSHRHGVPAIKDKKASRETAWGITSLSCLLNVQPVTREACSNYRMLIFPELFLC